MAKINQKAVRRPSDKYNKSFSEEFRKSKVIEYQKGLVNISDLCRLYGISRTTVYKWIYLYTQVEKGVKTVVQMDSESLKTKILLEKVGELERVIGQKQLEIDFLNKMIEIAGEELGFDIKKKAGQVQLNGLESIKNQGTGK